jgi:hypothetical protein
MKYLVFRHKEAATVLRMYIFPKEEQHKSFAKKIGENWIPIRGGFIRFDQTAAIDEWHTLEGVGMLRCYGESFSLGLQSDPKEDDKLLYDMLEKF